MANTSDDLVNLMQGVQGDPSDPNVQKAKLALLFSRWGKPQTQPSDSPDTLDSTPGAGADGTNNGSGQPKVAPGTSEQSAQDHPPTTPLPSPGQIERARNASTVLTPTPSQPSPDAANDDHLKTLAKTLVASGAPIPGASAEPGSPAESGSTADLESRVPFGGSPDSPNIPPVIAAAARASQEPHGVLGVLGAIGKAAGSFAVKQVLPRVGMAGYAVAGGDPEKLRLAQEQQKFEEEQANRQYGLEKQKVGLQSRSVDIDAQRAQTEQAAQQATASYQQGELSNAQKQLDIANRSLDEEAHWHQRQGDLEEQRNVLEEKHLDLSRLQLGMFMQQFEAQMQMNMLQFGIQDVDRAADQMVQFAESRAKELGSSWWSSKKGAQTEASKAMNGYNTPNKPAASEFGTQVTQNPDGTWHVEGIEEWRQRMRKQVMQQHSSTGVPDIFKFTQGNLPPTPPAGATGIVRDAGGNITGWVVNGRKVPLR